MRHPGSRRGRHALPRRPIILGVVTLLVASLISVVSVLTLATAPPAEASVRQAFGSLYSAQENGAIAITGNAQLSCQTSISTCAASRAGTTATSNNDFTMAFVDADSSSATSNSTSADLNLPAGSTVLSAFLIWGGRLEAGSGGVAATGTGATAKLQVPGATAYTTLTGTLYNPGLTGSTNSSPYQTAIDITTQVRAAGNGTYWVGDIQAATGVDRYAGWALAVAYRNPAAPLRDLRIFRGFADVTTGAGNSDVSIPINGFLTPATGAVNASVGVVAWEGDRGITGDALKLNGTTLSDAAHPATNFFNSAISDAGVNIGARTPSYVNNLGVDVARISANGVLANNSTSTTLNLTTTGDFYYPGLVTTQIDLFTPAFNPVSKTVVNLNGNDPAKVGDTLEYRISLTNTGADFADRSVITDALTDGVSYVPGSTVISTNSAGAGTGARTDAAGDDVVDYSPATSTLTVRAGLNATSALGGTLAPNDTVSFRFRATVDRDAAGTTLPNNAQLSYLARTIANSYSFVGNVVSTPVAAIADLGLTKTSGPTAQTAGNQVTYTLTATNNGPNAATNTTVVDTLPAGLSYVSSSPPAGTTCTNSGQQITCTTPSLANGGVLSIPIVAKIAPGTAAGTVSNTAVISSDITDDVSANNTAVATTAVSTSADLSLTNTAAPGTVSAGNQVTYTLTATNNGPSNAAAVTISDPLPAGTTFVSATASTGSCAYDVGTRTVSCAAGTLGPAAVATVTLVVRVGADVTATSIVNPATVSSTTPDGNSANNSAAATVTVNRSADLALTKTASTNPVVAGTALTYTIAVTNNGPSDATSVVVSDPAVAGLTVVSAGSTVGSCAVVAGAVNCTIGALANTTTATITVQATVAAGRAAGPLANTASVTSDFDPTPANNSATATVTVNTSADLSVQISSSPATIVYGSPVSYTAVATNNGPSTATGVTLTNTLPAGFSFVSSASGCTAVGQVVTCPVGTLAVGASASATYQVSTPAAGSGDVSNTVTVSGTTSDPVNANNSATAVSSTTARADLSLTKTATPTAPVAGQSISYTLVATNNGPSNATAVTITDPLPSAVAFLPGASSPGCSVAGGTVTCTVGTIASGASVTVTIGGLVSPAATGSLVNTATVASATVADPTPGNNSATVTSTIAARADIAVDFRPATAGPFIAGNTVGYLLDVTNNGPSNAANVVVTGAVPPGMTPVLGSSGGACTVAGGTVTCNLGTVPAGATVPLAFQAIVNSSTAAGTITGLAQAGSSTPDANAANNSDTADITVITSADLAVTKTVTPSPLVAGSTGTFTVAVKNNGPSDARTVVLTDPLAAGLTPVTANSTIGSCTVAGQNISCAVGTIGAGATATVTITATVDPARTTPIANTASVTSGTTDPTAGNNSDTVTPAVVSRADLRLTKTATPEPVRAGTAVTYTLTATNVGPSAAAAVTLADTLPAGLTALTVSSVGNVCAATGGGSAVNCAFGTLAAGASRTVVVTALVPETAAAGSTVANTATLASPTTDPIPADNSATATSTVSTEADLAILVSPVNDPAEAGTNHSYVVSVSNNGPSTARGVVVTNPVPAGSTFVSATSSVGSCTVAGGVITCDLGDLPRGASPTIQITVDIDPSIAGATLTDKATVSSAPATGSPTTDPDLTNNSSTVGQPIAGRSDLDLTKTVISGPIVAGSQVSYLLTVSNNGPSYADTVVINDLIPAGTTLVSATAAGGGSCAATADSAAVNCTWATVPTGTLAQRTRTAVLVIAVPSSTVAGSTISNTATATSASPDPTPATATATGQVTATADLAAVKTLVSGNPTAGGQIRWQIAVTNNGPSQATAVQITDTAPAGVTFTSAGTGSGTCTVTASTLDCELGTVANQSTVTATVVATIAAGYTGPDVTNTATVSSTTTDPTPGNNTGTVTNDIATSADLAVTMTTPPSAAAGTPVSWTVVVTNNGPSVARAAALIDTLPAGLGAVTGVVTGGGNCAVNGVTAGCLLGDLAVGQSTTITFTGTVLASFTGTSVTNSATATSSTPDPNTGNNSATVTSPVTTVADLTVTATGPATAVAGGPISWQVQVTNNGPSDAQAASLLDQLPAGLVGVIATGPNGSCPITGTDVTCQLGTLAPGTTVTITVTATVDPAFTGTSLATTATGSSNTTEATPADNVSGTSTTVGTSADVSVVKQADTATFVPGTSIGWTVTVANAGPSVSRNVVVTDTLPGTVSAATATFNGGTSTCTLTPVGGGTEVSCALGDVAVGMPVRIAIGGLLAATAPAGTLGNTATATADTADPTAGNNTGSASTPVVPSADLRIGKSITSGSPVAGAPISYRIEVTNGGPSASTGVTVTDTLPTEITGATATVTTGGGSCTVTGSGAGQTLDCTLGTIALDATSVIEVTGTIGQNLGDQLSNTATVSATSADPRTDNNSSTAVGSVGESADLQISQTAPAQATAGDQVSWTVTVTNNGPSIARDVSLADQLPAGISGATGVITGGGSCTSLTACNLGNLTPGQTVTITITGTLSPSFQANSISNGVSVSSPTPDPNGGNNSATANTAVNRSADLSAIKTVSPNPLVPGRNATYTIVVSNTGPSDGAATIATDPLPDGLTVRTPGPTATAGSCVLNGRVVQCDLGAVPAGQTVLVSVPVRVDASYTGASVVNTATVSSATPDPTPGNNGGTSTADVQGLADLTVTKSAPATVIAGTPLSWTIRVNNAGPSDAQTVAVSDLLPAGITDIVARTTQGACTTTEVADRVRLDCVIGTLGAGDTARIDIVVDSVLDPSFTASSIANTATVTSGTPEPGADPNEGRSSGTTTAVTTLADVHVSKVPTTATFVPGQPVGWDITVTNDGPSTARDVTVADTLPAGLTNVVFNPPAGVTCPAGAVTGSPCVIGDLLPGKANAVTIEVRADLDPDVPLGIITNSALAASATPDNDPGDNEVDSDVPVNPTADLAVTNVPSTTTLRAGETVSWVVTVTNNGPSTSRNVTLAHVLPAELTGVTVDAPAGITCDLQVVCDLGDLPAGAVRTFTITATIPADYAPDTLSTTSEVSSPATPDINPVNNSDTAVIGLTTAADLTITKTGPATVVAGTAISWTLQVTNTGPSDAADVVVTDLLPPGIGDVTASFGSTDCAIMAIGADPVLVTCELGVLAPSATPTVITIFGTVSRDYAVGPADAEISNTATVSSITPEPGAVPDQGRTSPPVVTAVTTSADLDVAKTAVGGPVLAGETAAWDIVVTNLGPSTAEGVVVADTLPAGLTGVTFTSGATIDCTPAGVCTLADPLAVGAAGAVTIRVSGTVAADFDPAGIDNAVTVSADTPDPVAGNNFATSSVAVGTTADLSVTNVPGSTAVLAGNPVSFTVTVTNNGSSTARAVTLTDLLPTFLTGVLVTGPAGISCDNLVVCQLGDLDPGAANALVFTITGTVPADHTGTTMATIAQVTSASTPDPLPGNNSAPAAVTIGTAADLTIGKTGPIAARAGDELVWTIDLSNAGPSVARDTVLSDLLPAGVVAAITDNPACTVTPGTGGRLQVSCDLDTVGVTAAGSSGLRTTVTGTLAADYLGDELVNTATVSSTTVEPGADPTAGRSDTSSTEITAEATLTITKTPTTSPFVPGTAVAWDITVTNSGPSTARNVVVTDTLPATGLSGVTFDPPTGTTCTAAGVCTIGDLPPGAADAVVIGVTADLAAGYAAATIANTAAVSSPTDPDDTDHTVTSTVPVAPSADLTVTNLADTDQLRAGEQIGWTVTVTNNGPSTARAVRLTDLLPGVLTGVSVLAPPGVTCDNQVVCDLGDLPPGPGNAVQIFITATVPTDFTGTEISTTAVVSSTGPAPTPDPVSGNNSENSTVGLSAAADLTITKTGPTSATAGTDLTWTLQVTNTGPSQARAVQITDLLPVGITDVVIDIDPAQGSCTQLPVAGGRILVTCELGNLDPGSIDLSITGALSSGFQDADVVNAAAVSSPTPEPVTGQPDGRTVTNTTPVQALADVTVTKTPVATPFTAGLPAAWDIVVTNAGPSTARSVVATDTLPAGLTGVTFTPPSGVGCTATGTCTIGDLLPGAANAVTIRVAGTVAAGYLPTSIANTVDVSTTTAELDDDNSVTSTVPVTTEADLQVSNIPSVTDILAGQSLSWTITVLNDGPSTSRSVLLSDLVPAGLTGVSISAPTGVTCDAQIICTIGDLAPGVPLVFTLNATVPATYTGPSVVTTAVFSSITTPDPDADNDSATATVTVGTAADLTLTKTGPTGTVLAGDPISWTLQLTNAGPSVARTTVISDLLPAGVIDAGTDNAACAVSAGAGGRLQITCTLGTVDSSPVTVTVSGTVAATFTGTSLTNTATVASTTGEPGGGSAGRSDTATTTVAAEADLTVTKIPVTAAFVPGLTAAWDITVSNDGPSTARGVVLTDTLPADLTDVTFTTPAGVGCTDAGICSLGAVQPGAGNVVTIRVSGTLTAGFAAASVRNTATVASLTTDPDTDGNTVNSDVPVTPRADLAVTNVAAPTTVAAGEAIGWTVTVANLGPSVARGVTLSDLLPAGLADLVVVADNGTTCTTAVACSFGDLAPGAGNTITLTITGRVPATFTGTSLPTTATIGSTTTDPVSGNNSASANIAVATAADLVIDKTGPVGPVVAGEPISWDIEVTNNGPSVARNVRIVDIVPASVLSPVFTSDDADCSALPCTVATLAPGDSVTVTISGQVDPDHRQATVVNTASVLSDTTDPGTTPNSSTAVTEILRQADLSLVKTVSPVPAVPGQPLSYQLTVNDAGPSTAVDVAVTDSLPASLLNPTVSTTVGDCSLTDGVVACSADTLGLTTPMVVTISGTLDPEVAAGDIANTATVTSSTPDENTDNNTDSIGTPTAPADLTITKTAGADSVAPEGSISWIVTVSNAGPAPARGVVITDQLPAGVAIDEVSIDQGSCGPVTPGGPLVCLVGTIGVAETVTLTVIGTVGATVQGSLTNSAGVVSPDESDPADNAAEVTVPVTAAADLALTKTASTDEVVAGESISWTLTVTNAGPAPASDVVVADVLPVGLLDPTSDTAGCAIADGVLTCSVDSLAVGGTAEFVVSGTVDPGLLGDLVNTASVTSVVPDLHPEDNEAASTVAVSVSHGLTVSKTAADTQVELGGATEYLITVANSGPSTATGVTVTENLPAGAEISDATTEVGTFDPNTLIWSVGSVPAGGSADLVVTVSFDKSGSAVNSVTVGADGLTGPAPEAEATVEVLDSGSTSTANPPTTSPGSTTGPASPTSTEPVPTTAPPAPPTTGPGLPNTGYPVSNSLWVALLLMLAGLGVAVLGRRRQGGHH